MATKIRPLATITAASGTGVSNLSSYKTRGRVVRKEMNMKCNILTAGFAALALASLTPAAFAHSAMSHASIADHAKLTKAPENFTATFEHPTALASVALRKSDGKAVPLDYKTSTEMAKSFTIPLPSLAAGGYTLSWKTVAKDGHAMKGAVHFTVTG